MGMRYEDFCGLTPDEFNACYKAYSDAREADFRAAWERTRVLATYTLQPHAKHHLVPKNWFPFPWEQPKAEPAPKVSKAEALHKFEELVKRTQNKAADM